MRIENTGSWACSGLGIDEQCACSPISSFSSPCGSFLYRIQLANKLASMHANRGMGKNRPGSLISWHFDLLKLLSISCVLFIFHCLQWIILKFTLLSLLTHVYREFSGYDHVFVTLLGVKFNCSSWLYVCYVHFTNEKVMLHHHQGYQMGLFPQIRRENILKADKSNMSNISLHYHDLTVVFFLLKTFVIPI